MRAAASSTRTLVGVAAVALVAVALVAACASTPGGNAAPTSVTLPRPSTGSSPDQPPVGALVPGAAVRGERERCLDRELTRRGLNEYGDPSGTTYPEGSPLYDVITKSSTDRFSFVAKRHPDIGVACSRAPVSPER